MRALTVSLILVLVVGALAWRFLADLAPGESAGPSAPLAHAAPDSEQEALVLAPDTDLEVAGAAQRRPVEDAGGETRLEAAPERAPAPLERLVVRVVDPAGEPVPGTRIRAREGLRSGFPRRELANDATDAEGLLELAPFELEPREEVDLSLVLRPPEGWVWMEWRGPVPDTSELVVELAPASRLSGSVRISSGRELPPESKVTLDWRLDARRAGRATVSVEAGRYATGFQLAGRLTRIGLLPRAGRSMFQDSDVQLVEGADQDLDLVFRDGCTCTLTFLDADSGEPIEGGEVRLDNASMGQTDARGSAAIVNALAAGASSRLRFDHPDYPRFRSSLDCPDPSIELAAEFRVSRGHSVGGVLEDVRGAPLPGVRVTCQQQFGSRLGSGSTISTASKRTTTDEEGRFRLSGLAAGEGYDLVFLEEYVALGRERIAVPDERERWVVYDGIEVHGSVRSAGDEPVTGAAVRAMGAWGVGQVAASTDADGEFLLEGLFPGTWYAEVEYGPYLEGDGDGYSPRLTVGREFEVFQSGAPRVDLVLPPAPAELPERVQFVLHLLDASTGAPIEFTEIVFVIGLDSSVSIGTGGPVGADGYRNSTFEGRYDLVVRCAGYRPGVLSVELEAGGAPNEFELELEPEG